MGHVVQNVGVTEVQLQKIIDVWVGLDARKRFILVLACLATSLLVFAMSKMATSPNMTLLYAGWHAPIGWSGLIVSASSASGPLARCFRARADDSPMSCAA